MKVKTISKLFSLVTKVEERKTKEHLEFLDFYQELVLQTSSELTKKFGELPVETEGGTALLSVDPVDFGYWHTAIKNGVRFKKGASQVKLDIYNRLANKVKDLSMTAEERSEFIQLVKSGEITQ